MRKFVILPSNNDLNRGDQALIWETIEVAKKAGCTGEFYMLAEKESLTKQSQSVGINVLTPILKHPSRKFKTKENNEYNSKLLLKWGSVASIDFISSMMMLTRLTRAIIVPFLSEQNKHTLKTIKESDACFVKGGGFIHSAGRITDFYTIYYSLFHLLLAQSLGKPIYVMPNSFGPFHGLGVEWLVRKVLSQCKLVTVRESISKEMLSEIGVDSILFPDLGFALYKNQGHNTEVNELQKLHPDRKLVAITARPYRFPDSSDPGKKYQNYINNMIIFSKWLYVNNYLPVFIDHTLSENTHESDAICINEIVSKLNKDEVYIIGSEDYTCRDLKSIYSEFDYVVGTRFHSVIFALSENVPSIAITYGGNKGQGIMNDLGLSDYAIKMSEFTAEKAIEIFSNLCRNKEQICLQLKYNKLQTVERHKELVNKVKENLLTN